MAKEKKQITEVSFINPFDSGVTYEQFLASIPEGVDVKEHCKNELTQDQIEWLEADLNIYINHKKK